MCDTVNQAIKPRPPTATSIPSLLTIFQNEWDALMLETYTLKQHLDAMRQELSQALYQHDAACRVIARLIRERDEARAALSQAQSQLAQALSSSRVGEASVIDTIPAGVSQEALNKIVTLSKALSKQRKKRTIPESLASKEQIQSWTVASSHPLHKPSKPGILCLDINPNQPNIVSISRGTFFFLSSYPMFSSFLLQQTQSIESYSTLMFNIALSPILYK